jgi:hypothetical protein
VDESWRVALAFRGGSPKRRKSALASHLVWRLGTGVRVTPTETGIVLYACTADTAVQAESAARDLVLRLGVAAADFRLEHWDPVGGKWQHAVVNPEQAAAWARSQEEDRVWSVASGKAAWTVRVELASHHDLVLLARRLKSGGWQVIRRRKYLLAGANCEDDASRLAAQIRADTSADAVVSVERTTWNNWGDMLLYG